LHLCIGFDVEANKMETTRVKILLADYDRMARAIRMRLFDRYNAKLVWGMIADARREFATLIPKIPYIGNENVWQFNLDTCVMDLALYRAMKKYGFTLHEAVQMIYDVFEAYLQSFPKPLRMVYRWYHLSPINLNKLRKGAAASQLRKYPEDWVFTYVYGDRKTFDAGVDITECAIVKFYQKHGAEEFVPFLCNLDHALGKWFGLGFTRRGTLAEGAPICDCRWARGADTPDWPPATLTNKDFRY